MKKTLLIILSALIILAAFTGCGESPALTGDASSATNPPLSSEPPTPSATPTPTATPTPAPVLKDGVYEGKSPLTAESYYGKAIVTIEGGKITGVDFSIYDTRYFKTRYEGTTESEMLMTVEYGKVVFAENLHYQDQVVNELAGMEKYEAALIETQNIKEVDVISKATWSYYIYVDAVKDALKKAAE